LDQYGGVGIDRVDEALAPWAEKATTREVEQAMEALIFNLNSLHSRAGNQIPFSSISLGVGVDEGSRKVCKAILDMYDKGLGKGEVAMFPNIVFKIKEGVNWEPGTPNHDLLLRALEVSSRRMNPTYLFLDAPFNKPYGHEVMAMGCRTRVIANRFGGETTNGRGNIAFTSINLPRIAIKVKTDNTNMADFWRELDRTLAICEKQLMHRWGIISKLYVKDVPFVFGEGLYMGSENLKPDDTIGEALKNGTLSIGFVGLAETLVCLTGYNHAEDEKSQRIGLEIVTRMRKFCDEASERNNMNFSLIGTPAETLAGRFLGLDRKQFGVIAGVTDKEYYTNSFHVPVVQHIDIMRKIKAEAPYHALCNAGHISYIELGSPPHPNIDGLNVILTAMKDSGMGYIGFNFPIDYCVDCNYMGVFGDECPSCHKSESIRRIRRVTGYFSTEHHIGNPKWAEIIQRVSHANRRD
jgi:ribonucleoside-triphosphate reductase